MSKLPPPKGFANAESASLLWELDQTAATVKATPGADRPLVLTEGLLQGLIGAMSASAVAALDASKDYTRATSLEVVDLLSKAITSRADEGATQAMRAVLDAIKAQAREVGPRGERGPEGFPGQDGQDGEIGPMPASEWDAEGIRVRFEVEPGVWGPWSEKLRGPSGRNGANAGAGTVSFRSVGGGGAFDDVGVIGGGGSDFSPSAVFGGGGASSGATLVINGGRA